MDKFTENLIKKIEEKNIKPKSKISCDLKKILDVFIFSLIILFDSFLFSLIFFYIKTTDFDKFLISNSSVLFTVPYFWISLFLGLITVSFFYFYEKMKGYRVNPVLSIFIIFSVTITLGFTISSFKKINHYADEALSLNMPFYYNTIMSDDIWDDNCCNDGKECSHCLIGRLKSIEIDDVKKVVKFFDCRKKEFFETYYEGDLKDVYDCNFILDERYKIIAQKSSDGRFKILEIRSWDPNECPKKR